MKNIVFLLGYPHFMAHLATFMTASLFLVKIKEAEPKAGCSENQEEIDENGFSHFQYPSRYFATSDLLR
ncbi:hypothetical protein I6N96_07880 [Enterococcus sp. BWM-S5]|uniref:Uncharacterized protein n=1 Tax=Enterococcus larvae TaxID=2794352 RepID=A0ABS4CHU5_9ENTE|nr:hypothetical protein [Enterococcus larvae]MBP1046200.1 hypothetical protein [Enterococcus larvae]